MQNLRRSLPLLNALVAFESAARHRSLTRAAAEIGISQSAVSRHVSNLEAQTGLALFHRRHKAIEPTEQGLRLAAAVASGFGHVRAVLEELRQQRPERALTVACTYDVASLWLMPRLASLRAMLKSREIRLTTSDSYIDFGSPDIDMSVRFGDGRWPGFASLCLVRERAFAVAAPTLVRSTPALRTAKSAKDILQLPLLELQRTGPAALDWAEWFRRFGLKSPAIRSAGSFTSYAFLLQAAVEGRGVALGWHGLVDDLLDRGALQRVTKLQVETRRGLFLVYRSDTDPALTAAAAQAFRLAGEASRD